MDSVYDVSKLKEMLYPIFDENPIYTATLFGSYAKGNAT